MQRILGKRACRELRDNAFRYLLLGGLIVLGMYMVISLAGAAETVIRGVEQKAEENKLEDGEFTVFVPMTEAQEQHITDMGITLEKMFSVDMSLADSTVRVFPNRQAVNLIALEEGRLAETGSEAVIEKRYSEEHGLNVGDTLEIADRLFTVTGIGTVPDYDGLLQNISDSNADSRQFGLLFVTQEQYAMLRQSDNSSTESYTYAYRLHDGGTSAELKAYLKVSSLILFMEAENNPRIKASANDQTITKWAGLTAGIIIMALFAYVISVFVIHTIEKESSIMGALYALGVRRKDLLVHYLVLPAAITWAAGMAGTVLGFSRYGLGIQMRNSYDYFSVPSLQTVYPVYLILYGTVMPPAVAVIVNSVVIYRKLSRPVLSLLRKTPENNGKSRIRLDNIGFAVSFRIRHMMKEARTGFTVILGMFMSLLVLMLGMDCYIMCVNIEKENKEDTGYEYMYTYKYPEETVPQGGEGSYVKILSKEMYGYQLDVTLLGLGEETPYFDVAVPKAKNKLVISSAAAQKYRLQAGDKVILTDKENDMDYAFTIEAVTPYSVGLHMFMDIESMRELFGQSREYYNAVFSDKPLTIDRGRLYSITTKADIIQGAQVFIDLMLPLIAMLNIVTAIMFFVVMYLMMKVMIDRASYSISLLKILGYRKKEIRSLYLDGNFCLIAAGAAISIPLAKSLIDNIFPLFIANVACGVNISFSPQMYGGIYIGVILLYLVINKLLTCRLARIHPTEILKNRE